MELYTKGSSLKGVSYVLVQKIRNETEFIQCGSATSTEAQKSYLTMEVELQAVLLACDKLPYYLRFAEGTICWCDNTALVGCSSKDFTLNRSPWVILMLQKLLLYNLTFKQIEGKRPVRKY